MPYTYHIDHEQQLARIGVHGVVTGKDILLALQDVVADPGWHPGYSRLWDFRGCVELAISPEEGDGIRRLFHDPRYRSAGTAFVVHRSIEELAVQFFQTLTRGWKVKPFWSAEEALAWLGKDPGVARGLLEGDG